MNKRSTIRPLTEALRKPPESRTPEEEDLIREWGSAEGAELVQKVRDVTDAIAESSSLSKFREQIEALRKVAESAVPSSFRVEPLNDRIPMRELLEQQAAEEAERRQREIDTVELLNAIFLEMVADRRERQRIAESVARHEEELIRIRSGSPGRPSSRHLVIAEFHRRVEAGMIEKNLAEESRTLATWLSTQHPDVHPMQAKSIANVIRGEFRAADSRSPRR